MDPDHIVNGAYESEVWGKQSSAARAVCYIVLQNLGISMVHIYIRVELHDL